MSLPHEKEQVQVHEQASVRSSAPLRVASIDEPRDCVVTYPGAAGSLVLVRFDGKGEVVAEARIAREMLSRKVEQDMMGWAPPDRSDPPREGLPATEPLRLIQ
jgi:hypothetical protein